jgi:hypothetical protein
MDNKESVDNNEQMVGIPEGIEASEFLERFRQVEPVTPEPWRG